MQILGLLGMFFDAAVVFVTNSSLLFRSVSHTVAPCYLFDISSFTYVEIPGMDLQKLIKMKSISQLCKSVERKQSKEPENMGLKITTIFGLHLLTIWNISRHLKLVSIAPLISKVIHLIPIIATFILLLRITPLDPLHQILQN